MWEFLKEEISWPKSCALIDLEGGSDLSEFLNFPGQIRLRWFSDLSSSPGDYWEENVHYIVVSLFIKSGGHNGCWLVVRIVSKIHLFILAESYWGAACDSG